MFKSQCDNIKRKTTQCDTIATQSAVSMRQKSCVIKACVHHTVWYSFSCKKIHILIFGWLLIRRPKQERHVPTRRGCTSLRLPELKSYPDS